MLRRNYGGPAPKRKLPWAKGRYTGPLKKQKRPIRNEKCPCLSGKKFKACCKTVEVLIPRLKELIAEDEKNADND